MRRDWAVPAVLGLLVAAGLWAATASDGDDREDGDGTQSATSTSTPPPAVLPPFPQSLGLVRGETTHVVLAPHGRAEAMALLNETPAPPGFGLLDWQSDAVALYTAPDLFAGCQGDPAAGDFRCSDPPWAFGPWVLPRTEALADNDTSPRFAEEGYNAGRVTAYVFDERGLLVATNAEADEAARLAGTVEYTRLSNATWYMGSDSTAPNGTEFVPSLAQPFVDRLHPLLEGLPVGGVASIRSNAYVNFYGTLFVTVRIDSLVHAP